MKLGKDSRKKQMAVWRALALAVAMLSGCIHVRTAAVGDVPDVGPVVNTKYRYFYVGDEKDMVAWLRGSEPDQDYKNAAFAQCHPNVFAEDGIRVCLDQIEPVQMEYWGYGCAAVTLQAVVTLYFSGLFPTILHGSDYVSKYRISVAGLENGHDELTIWGQTDEAWTFLSPLSILCFNGTPDFDGSPDGRVFKATRFGIGVTPTDVEHEALAYAVAVKLKQMEDSGMINDDVAKKAVKL